ncbi:MAG: periplasmic heavy metal sensor [Pseudomonadota bacterium]
MTETTPKPTPRWMRLLLVLSLGANLLVIGAFLGAKLSGGAPSGKAERGAHQMSLGPYGRALSKEDRAALRAAFSDRRPWFKQSRQQMREIGRELVAAMRMTPFDLAVVEQLLSKQSEMQSAFQAEGRGLLLERIEAMTPDQRAAFAEKLEKGLNKGRR